MVVGRRQTDRWLVRADGFGCYALALPPFFVRAKNSFAGRVGESAYMKPVTSSLLKSLSAWSNAGLGFLYPEVCQTCGLGRATPAEGFVCESCRASARWIEPPFCGRCGLPFEGAITTAFACG